MCKHQYESYQNGMLACHCVVVMKHGCECIFNFLKILQKLIENFNFHNYDSLLHADSKKVDPRRRVTSRYGREREDTGNFFDF